MESKEEDDDRTERRLAEDRLMLIQYLKYFGQFMKDDQDGRYKIDLLISKLMELEERDRYK